MQLSPTMSMSIAEDLAYQAGAAGVIERSDTTIQADDAYLIHATAQGWAVHRYPCNTPISDCHTPDELLAALSIETDH